MHLDEDAEADGEDAAADDLELHSWHSRHGSRRRHQPTAHAARAAAVDIDLIDGHRDGRLRFASAESGADAAAEAEAQAAREMDMAAAGVDVDDEPLQAQILSQKRLATYYGEVHLGDQPFKGACRAGEGFHRLFRDARVPACRRSVQLPRWWLAAALPSVDCSPQAACLLTAQLSRPSAAAVL
jgi:hypothetical protein